jgi:hypothetical protein
MSNDALSAQVNNNIYSVKDGGIECFLLWIPSSLSGVTRGAANEAYDGVSGGREKRAER